MSALLISIYSLIGRACPTLKPDAMPNTSHLILLCHQHIPHHPVPPAATCGAQVAQTAVVFPPSQRDAAAAQRPPRETSCCHHAAAAVKTEFQPRRRS